MSVSRTALVGSLLMGASLVLAADEELPDPDFLEYLGTWEESDEDWLIFEEPVTAELEELEAQMGQPHFWNDTRTAAVVSRSCDPSISVAEPAVGSCCRMNARSPATSW